MTNTSLDQPARVTKAAIRQAEGRVVETLDLVWQNNDPNIATKFLQQGDAVEQLTALMRAEFLYGLSKDWTRRGMRGEFIAWATHRTGKDKVYVERRVRVGAMLADTELPALYRDKLKFRSIEELIIVSSAWDGGDLRPTKPQWDKLLEQPDPASLGDEIRRLLGRPERANALTIFWCADGTLEAWQDGQCEPLGFLKRPPEGEKSLLARAVGRLTKGRVKDR
jgi:hypothetical protein